MGILDFKLKNGTIINETGMNNVSASALIKALEYNFPHKIEDLVGRINGMLNKDIGNPVDGDLSELDTLCDDIISTITTTKSMISSLECDAVFDTKDIIAQNYKVMFLNKDLIMKEGLHQFGYIEEDHKLFSYNPIDNFLRNFNTDEQLDPVILTPVELSKIDKYSDFPEYVILFSNMLEIVSLIYDAEQYLKLVRRFYNTDNIIREYDPRVPIRPKSDSFTSMMDAPISSISIAKKSIYDLRLKLMDNKQYSPEDLEVYKKIIYTIYNQFCLSAIVLKKHINSILNKKHYYEAVIEQIEKVKKFIESNGQ